MATVREAYQWDDPFLLDDRLPQQPRLVRACARARLGGDGVSVNFAAASARFTETPYAQNPSA